MMIRFNIKVLNRNKVMIRYKNLIEFIIKVTAIIFLSSKISFADFDDGMDGINKGNFEILVIFEKDNCN